MGGTLMSISHAANFWNLTVEGKVKIRLHILPVLSQNDKATSNHDLQHFIDCNCYSSMTQTVM